MWFAYVWIVLLGGLWLLWTYAAVIDAIDQWQDAKGNLGDFLDYLFSSEVFSMWAIVHLIVIFVASVSLFAYTHW